MLRELPARARWYILAVIGAGVLTLALLLPRAALTPVVPLIILVFLSSLTSAFKVYFPIATGSNMSVSYVVDIASLILRGPHATMIVGAASGWSQTVVNTQSRRQPWYRVAFNMACLVLTVELSGQVYQRLGGVPQVTLPAVLVPLVGMALTYYVANTGMIALVVALSTDQSAWRVWKSDFASSAPNYLLGAAASAIVIAATQSAGYWLTLLLTAAPLYLTYKVYRASVETEARQGAILEAAYDAIVTFDERLNIREFNPAAERMFGHRRGDILGRGVELLLPAEERAGTLHAFRRFSATGEGLLAGGTLELTGVRADGTEFPCELTAARIGSGALVTAFVRDITERRALEQQLQQSQKLEAIGRLAGGVAHDFNNVLMSIIGSADLLLMQLDPGDPARGEVLEIGESVRRGASLTRQLLAFSRRQASSPRLFALGDVVVGMDTMLRRLIGPEIDLQIQTPAPTSVIADPAQIEQVVLNLVINARDAMPEGGRLVVRVDEVTLDEAAAVAQVEGHPGRYARLSVADTGTGMDARTRARLFEPFFTTKEHGKGTGLGLSIVYGIVKQSGGYITLVSELGRGTTFFIHLPLVAAPQRAGAAV
ncbi:MAG: two-component system sensor histidine kinase NtrB [Betaproteobacteria bacterium]